MTKYGIINKEVVLMVKLVTKKASSEARQRADTASRERKKMIICKLIDRIEIGKDYDIRVKMNINYEQFIN